MTKTMITAKPQAQGLGTDVKMYESHNMERVVIELLHVLLYKNL